MKCSKERLDPDILFYETGKAVIKEVAVDVAIGAVTAGVGGLALKAGVKAAPYLGRFGMYAVNGVRKAVGFEKAGRVESEIAASGNTAGVGLKASADSLVGAESAQRMVRIEKTIQMIEEYMGERMKVTKPGVQGKSDLILTSADGTKKIRFDINNSHGLEPHVNVEIHAARNAYPGDKMMIREENHHIFPKNDLIDENLPRLTK